MRTYDDIFTDYCKWVYKKTEDEFYNPEHLNTEDEIYDATKKGRFLKEILSLSYRPEDGLYWFCKFILGDLTYAGYPEPIKFNSLWYKWLKISKNGSHIGILCSRQHSKTTFWSVILPIYRCSLYAYYNVLIESASEDQAIQILSYIKKIIENNEYLMSKTSKDAKWSSGELNFNNGKVRAKGVGGEVRGGTYDLIIADDILRSDNKFTDNDIEAFIMEELEPMILVRKGQLILVGTPQHDGDIFTTVEELSLQGGWKFYKYPAIIDVENKILLCPDRFTWEQLEEKRKIMGEMKFQKEFMCVCYSEGTQLFPDSIRKTAKALGKNEIMIEKPKPIDFNEWRFYGGLDCARAGSASADYTVVFIIGIHNRTNMKKLFWMWRDKGLKLQTQVEKIAQISANYQHPPILVEKNNVGIDFIELLIDNYNLHIETFTTTSGSKEDLIRYLINSMENEKMIFPIGDDKSREKIRILDNELGKFIVKKTRAGNERLEASGSSHDDAVISLALANKCAQGYAVIPCAATIERTKNKTDLELFAASNDELFITKW